jgi:DNA helicase II / ATP-dependent DNA helicase PcrA
MDAQTTALPPLQLLKEVLPRYRLYKEADLVLGNEQILLSTIHKAKGMEFQRVIIPDADDINYFSSVKAEQREEMARLLYVALSRSKSEIHICYATFPNTYSRKKGYASLNLFLEPVKTFFIWKNI